MRAKVIVRFRVGTFSNISWIFFGSDVWVSAELEQHAGLRRIELQRRDGADLVVVDLDVAADDPFADAARPHDHDALGHRALRRASSAGVVMLPSPTPATTSPLAPLATAASIRSGDMPACA